MSKGYEQAISENKGNKHIVGCPDALVDRKRKRMELLKLRNLRRNPRDLKLLSQRRGVVSQPALVF